MALNGGLVEKFCGALSAVRGQIDSASPGSISSYASALQAHSTELTGLLKQLRAGREDVSKPWRQGVARTSTLARMDELMKQLSKTIAVLEKLVPLLNKTASTLSKCQRGFATGVQSGSTRIAQILASGNPGAKAQAAASAAQTTSSLQGVISSFGSLLEALGVKGMGPLLNAVGQIAGQIEQVSKQNSTSPGSALSGSLSPDSLSPGSAQTLPEFTQYPWAGQQSATDDNSWIPVNQPVSGGDGAVKVVITTKDGHTATVQAAAHQDASFNLKVGDEDVQIAIDGDGDGRVS